MKKLLFAFFSYFLFTCDIIAQTISVDRTFGSTSCGVVESVFGSGCPNYCAPYSAIASFTLPNGWGVTVSGVNYFGGAAFAVTWVKSDGTVGSATYAAPTGSFSIVPTAADMANGKIFIAGYGNGAIAMCIDATTANMDWFVREPISVYGSYNAVAAMPDGRAIFWGQQTIGNSGGQNRVLLRRYNTDGSVDQGYSYNGSLANGYHFLAAPTDANYNGLTGRCKAIYQSSTDQLVVAFQQGTSWGSGIQRLFLARYSSNGYSVDNTFASGGYTNTGYFFNGHLGSNNYFDLKKIAGDKFRIAGNTTANQGKVLQYTANGQLDGGFGTGGEATFYPFPNEIRAMAVDHSTGKTYLFGNKFSTNVGYFGEALVSRLNSDGSLDLTFNGTGYKHLPPTVALAAESGFILGANRIAFSYNHTNINSGSQSRLWHSILDLSNTISIAASGNPVSLNIASGNVSCFTYQWYKDGIAIAGATGNSYPSPTPGSYYVVGTYQGESNQSNTIVISAIPTLSQWGIILLSLLSLAMIAAVAFAVRTQRSLVPAGTAVAMAPVAFVRSMPFNRRAMVKVLALLLPIAAIGFAAVHYFIGTNGWLDFAGTMVSMIIIGYVMHLDIQKTDK